MQNLYSETIGLMKKFNVTANKSYGQNFLIDESVIDIIIDKSNITKDTLVIEIGPGLGTLTKYLLEKAGKVIAIELDKKMINVLNKRFKSRLESEKEMDNKEKLEIINADILKVDLNILIDKELKNGYKSIKIVANLPYYITTPIIMKLLEEKLKIDSITVMVQKEVAERLVEVPGGGNTGAITYAIYYYSIADMLLNVPKDSFIPIPEVNSAVIKFDILKEPRVLVEDESKLFKVIKQSFMMKRKTLVNALNGFEGKEKNQILDILNQLNINDKIRAEKLTLNDFVNITKKIYE